MHACDAPAISMSTTPIQDGNAPVDYMPLNRPACGSYCMTFGVQPLCKNKNNLTYKPNSYAAMTRDWALEQAEVSICF